MPWQLVERRRAADEVRDFQKTISRVGSSPAIHAEMPRGLAY